MLIADLEIRLDAVVFRAGFARTIYQARQFVTHGHIALNGRRVDRPSHAVRPGDVVSVRDSSRKLPPFLAATPPERVPPYLEVIPSALMARLNRLPARDEVPVICDEQLVVEFYSR